MKGIVFWFLALSLFSAISHAEISPQLESIVQQLDWDMTRIGGQGQKYRVRAVTQLTCLGRDGEEIQERVLQTAGRLLSHENPIVVNAAHQVFLNLGAAHLTSSYLQPFIKLID
ncbi:MAG: hypothetical protein HYY61_03350 [Deltaproteobacteria bacterium]|nr:hypothetical protein [Deltaproteobacteria bacterium]